MTAVISSDVIPQDEALRLLHAAVDVDRLALVAA